MFLFLISNSPQISWLGSEVHHDGTPRSCSSLFSLCFYYTLGLRPSRWLTIPLIGLHPFLFSLFKLCHQLHVHIPPCSMTMIIITMVYVSLIPYLSLWGNIVMLFYRQWLGDCPNVTASKWLGQDSDLCLTTRSDFLILMRNSASTSARNDLFNPDLLLRTFLGHWVTNTWMNRTIAVFNSFIERSKEKEESRINPDL